jgi:hypothetical protein
MSELKKIEVNKEVTQPMNLKKRDRLIISGPCEIEIYDVTISPSLDYEIRAIMSMPRSNQFIKLKPIGLQSQQESVFFGKEKRKD